MSAHEIAHRFEVLRSLFEVSQQQRQALQEEQVDQFLALLEEREALIAECSTFEALETPDNVIPFPGTSMAGTQDAQSSDDAIALESLYAAIQHIDAENEHTLQLGLEDLRRTIGDLNQARMTARLPACHRPLRNNR